MDKKTRKKQHAKPIYTLPTQPLMSTQGEGYILVDISGHPSTPDDLMRVSPLTAPTALLLIVLFALTHTNCLLRWFNVAC